MSEIQGADKALADKKYKLAANLYQSALHAEPDNAFLYQGLASFWCETYQE